MTRIAKFFLIIISTFPFLVNAHPGSTDLYGCHHVLPEDRTETVGTEYHCHDNTGAEKYCWDKHMLNPNASKTYNQRRYEACVRSASPNQTYIDAEVNQILKDAEKDLQQYQYQRSLINEYIKNEETLEKQRLEENQKWFDDLINKNQKPTCPPSSSLGSDGLCYCQAGYEVSGNKCVLYTPKCQEGFYLSSSNGLCMPTQQQCKKEYGDSAKLNNNGECLYCPDGYFLNDDWMCELYQSKNTIDQRDNLETKISENKEVYTGSSIPKYFWYSSDYPATKRIKNFFKWIFD